MCSSDLHHLPLGASVSQISSMARENNIRQDEAGSRHWHEALGSLGVQQSHGQANDEHLEQIVVKRPQEQRAQIGAKAQ